VTDRAGKLRLLQVQPDGVPSRVTEWLLRDGSLGEVTTAHFAKGTRVLLDTRLNDAVLNKEIKEMHPNQVNPFTMGWIAFNFEKKWTRTQ
jgi:hypothetical protein